MKYNHISKILKIPLKEQKQEEESMTKRISAVILALVLAMTLLAGCGSNKTQKETTNSVATGKDDKETVKNNEDNKDNKDDNEASFTAEDAREYNIAMLKGPTAIGFIKAWDDSASTETNDNNKYNVTVYGAADEITAGIVKGDIDIAAVPCNLASVLYNKTNGGIKVAAINTLGVLYMISTSDDISTVADLKGKTIITTGQGTTPEYTLNYILEKNGLKPGEDVTIEYKSEATEVAAAMSEATDAVAMLPQPYVTTVLTQNENMKIVLDMTKEWEKVSDGSLVTGVVIVRNEVLEENKVAFDKFLADYKESTEYVNENVDDAAALVEKYDIFKSAIAKKAIPYCNIKFESGDEMKSDISSYLNVLFDADAKAVGGKLPDDAFYYVN